MTLRDGLVLQTGLMEKLGDLLKQATVERSHFYVGKCISETILEIKALQKALEAALAVIEADDAAEYKLAVLNAQDGINKDWRGYAKLQSAATAAFRKLEECLLPFRKGGL